MSLPGVSDGRGRLSFVEACEHVPFRIERIYYLTEVPSAARRGGHAHLRGEQFIIALAGSFDVIVDDAHNRETYNLDRSDQGLYIPSARWQELENFSAGAVCLVIASEHYEVSDYMRDYDEFVALARDQK